jgi:YVTN family beta-propeller protein
MLVRPHTAWVALAGLATGAVIGLVPTGASATSPRPVTSVRTYSTADVETVAVDQVNHLAYFAGDSTIEVINTRTGTHTPIAQVNGAFGLAVDDTTGLVYIPDRDNGSVVVVKGATIVKRIAMPKGDDPVDATVDPATGLVYVDEYAVTGSVSIIKGTRLLTSITVGNDPVTSAVDPSTGNVYVANSGGGTVSVIRGRKVIKTITVGGDPDELAVDPSRHLAYVSNDTTANVSVLHGTSLVHNVTVGLYPGDIAVDPRTHLAYVGHAGDSVSILDGKTLRKTVTTALWTDSPGYDATDGLVVFTALKSPTVSVFEGTKIVETLTTKQTANDGIGIDPTNGHAYAISFSGTAITELQVPTAGTIAVKRPTHRNYGQGVDVRVSFSCRRGTNNSVVSCTGSTHSGRRLNTTTLGLHHFSVALRQAFGATVVRTLTYRVVKS